MSFFEELKRRNVFRVGIAYTVAAWLLAQVADLVLENIDAPDWLMQTILLLLAIGLPLALIFAWLGRFEDAYPFRLSATEAVPNNFFTQHILQNNFFTFHR